VTPSSVYDYEVASGKSHAVWKRHEVLGGYDPTQYCERALWATARDGTKVPVSIVYKKRGRARWKSALFCTRTGRTATDRR